MYFVDRCRCPGGGPRQVFSVIFVSFVVQSLKPSPPEQPFSVVSKNRERLVLGFASGETVDVRLSSAWRRGWDEA